jgi:DNA-binding transcriptional LysR family regulator
MDVDPNLLRALAAVKQTGGFTQAARRLNLTQSAISHQIRRLEQTVGYALVSRTTRVVTLTDDGETFLTYAHRALSALDDLDRRFRREIVGDTVRVGVPDNFIGADLPSLLSRFASHFPDARLDVTVGMSFDLRALLEAGDLDLAVTMDIDKKRGGIALKSDQLVWVAAETFRHGRSSLPLAVYPAPCINRQVAVESLAECGIPWHVAFTCASPEGIHAAVLSGLAVSVMERSVMRPGLRIIDKDYNLPKLPVGTFRLFRSTRNQSPAVRAFEKLIVDSPRR